jgi:glycosyltransferase involved in cell wall biosynthesis
MRAPDKNNLVTLVIGPYPIAEVRNGGQKRAKAIYQFYKNLGTATYCGIFHRGHYPVWGKDDLPIGDPKIIAQVDQFPFATELICGEAIDKDVHVRSYIAKMLIDKKPDIIHLEQPFAFLGLKPLLKELGLHPIIIFGSQNIEYSLKQRIFKELKVARGIADKYVSVTKNLEYEFSRIADLVVAVNEEDAETHKEMGAKKVVIAPNGIEMLRPSAEGLQKWSKYKKDNNIKTLMAFVGSGHPPNWEGYEKMIGSDLAFLPSGVRLIIAGGVGSYFKNTYSKQLSNFWKHVDILGEVDEDTLSSLVSSSDVILLPIVTKRGSNLKTAEALIANTKIVATDSVFHGFERYKTLPNIFVGSSKPAFQKAIQEAISRPMTARSKEEQQLAQLVQWKHSVAPMKDPIMKLVKRKSLKVKFYKFKRALKGKAPVL